MINYEYINEDISNLILAHVERFNEEGTVTWIPIDEKNSDYQEYLRWVAKNNG